MSKIEWTDQTWNPIVGCSKKSTGCKNCYAEKMAFRQRAIAIANEKFDCSDYYIETVDEKGKWTGKVNFIEKALEKPLKRRKPTKYFVCSMGDLFHENVNYSWIDKVIEVIKKAPQHTFIVLTKRPDNMLRYFGSRSQLDPLFNLWLGVSAENQEQADLRIPILLQISAVKYLVSFEPLLEKINITRFIHEPTCNYEDYQICTCYKPHERRIDWVIAGAETGHGKRQFNQEWLISLQKQCNNSDALFFDKNGITNQQDQP